MVPRIFNARFISRAVCLGVLVALLVYAMLGLKQVSRVDLRSLAKSWIASRAQRAPGAGRTLNISSANWTGLQGQIRLSQARPKGTEAQAGPPPERLEGFHGRPLSDRTRHAFKEFTKYPFMEDPHYKESTCPKTVSSITKYSKWFKERFKPRIKVFLEKDDIVNFEDIAKFDLPFGYRRESRELFEKIVNHPRFSNASVHPDGKRKQCLRCAVVGCGGILKDSGAGPEIDGHDYVFRLNYAVTAGKHAKDVGTKTSFYIFFPESMSISLVLDQNAKFIYTMFKTYDMNYALNMLNGENTPKYMVGGREIYHLRKPGVNPAKVRMVHPDFFRYVFAEYLDAVSYRPTTGAMVVFLALHLCDEVTIYGFGYDPRFTMHYYDPRFIKREEISTGSHDVDNERDLWEKLHQEGVIRLFKRDI